MKVGDKVRLAHFHGSTGDRILAESGATGVIKSIEEEPEPNVLTRCVEVQWDDEACLEIATDLFPETVGAYRRIRENESR